MTDMIDAKEMTDDYAPIIHLFYIKTIHYKQTRAKDDIHFIVGKRCLRTDSSTVCRSLTLNDGSGYETSNIWSNRPDHVSSPMNTIDRFLLFHCRTRLSSGINDDLKLSATSINVGKVPVIKPTRTNFEIRLSNKTKQQTFDSLHSNSWWICFESEYQWIVWMFVECFCDERKAVRVDHVRSRTTVGRDNKVEPNSIDDEQNHLRISPRKPTILQRRNCGWVWKKCDFQTT